MKTLCHSYDEVEKFEEVKDGEAKTKKVDEEEEKVEEGKKPEEKVEEVKKVEEEESRENTTLRKKENQVTKKRTKRWNGDEIKPLCRIYKLTEKENNNNNEEEEEEEHQNKKRKPRKFIFSWAKPYLPFSKIDLHRTVRSHRHHGCQSDRWARVRSCLREENGTNLSCVFLVRIAKHRLL